MRMVKSFVFLPCLINAAFNKFPPELVENMSDYIDINCDLYIGNHTDEHYDSAADERKRRNIEISMRNKYPGLYTENVWYHLFLMILQNVKAPIVVMDDNKTGEHYITWIGYASGYFHDLVETNAFERGLLDDLLIVVQSYTYSRIAHIKSDQNSEKEQKKKFEVFIKDITGKMKLKRVEFDDIDEIEDETNTGAVIGIQTITNTLNIPQSVTYSQSMTKSSTYTMGLSDTFSFEIDEEIDIKIEENEFFASEEFDSKTTFKLGFSQTTSFSEALTNSNSKTVTYPLVAPPCSVVSGILSVSQKSVKIHFNKTFEIGGEQYVTDGYLISNGVEDETFSTEYISKSDSCNPVESNICDPSSIDPELIPQGDVKWTCKVTKNGRVCEAACVNGKTIEEYKVNCKKNRIGEFWIKAEKNQDIPDCFTSTD